MYRDVWKKYHGAVCSIEFFGSSGSRILGLTGFRTGNKIITDDLLYSIKEAREVVISFYKEDGVSIASSLRMGYHELLYILPDKEDFDNLGFAIIPAEFPEFRKTTSLELCKNCCPISRDGSCFTGLSDGIQQHVYQVCPHFFLLQE